MRRVVSRGSENETVLSLRSTNTRTFSLDIHLPSRVQSWTLFTSMSKTSTHCDVHSQVAGREDLCVWHAHDNGAAPQ